MCGLFGFLNYSGKEIKNLSDLTNSLAEKSATRGTDATGIAFANSGSINVLKESQSAYKMEFKHSDNVVALIGHTRHSTQGSEKKNYNNHPFSGKCMNSRFALAHNGVLCNDKELRGTLHLPKTKIETDSYIAVQLIESKTELTFESIKFMAEKIEGSFSFSIIDDKNSIYLVKGDSPLSILHFPNYKVYVYASTDEILYKSIIDSKLFSELKSGAFEVVEIQDGDILRISQDGNIEKYTFNHSHYYGRNWWDYGLSAYENSLFTQDGYVDDLKSVASYQGFSPDIVDELIGGGFTLEEIEDYIYEF